MTQGIQEQGGRLSAVEAESHFIQVRLEMLCADLVPCSHDAALQQAERRLYGIGVNVALNVNLVTVTDSLVLGAMNFSGNHRLWVGRHFVCNHHVHVSTDIFLDVLCECAGLRIGRVKESEFAATLP